MNEDIYTEETTPETAEEAAQTAPAGMFDPPPKSPHERAVAAYLEATASESLKAKIAEAQKSGKGIAECYSYIAEQARKKADGASSVMIADEEVYGWAVHYFEDEWRDELERDRKEAEDEKRREAEGRKAAERRARQEAEERANAEKREAERVAAMPAEEREAYEREKAAREAENAKRAERKAKALAKRAAEEAKRAMMEKWQRQQLSFSF